MLNTGGSIHNVMDVFIVFTIQLHRNVQRCYKELSLEDTDKDLRSENKDKNL